MESPFLRPDNPHYAEILSDAAYHVLGAHGIDRFSVRALARWMKVVPAAILNDYSRARVLDLIIICFERRWLAWSGSEPLWGPTPAEVPLCLPATPDERLGVRVLSALQHLAEAEALRGNSAPAVHLGRLQREEQALLGLRMRPSCCRQEPSDTAVQAVMALTRGLRLSLADEQPLLTHEVAVATLKDYVAAVTSHDAECAARRRAS